MALADRAVVAFVAIVTGIMADEMFLADLVGFQLGALLGSAAAGFFVVFRSRSSG